MSKYRCAKSDCKYESENPGDCCGKALLETQAVNSGQVQLKSGCGCGNSNCC